MTVFFMADALHHTSMGGGGGVQSQILKKK